MTNFNFTNEQIVFLAKHFQNQIEVLEDNILKNIQYTAGKMELMEQSFGDQPDFNRKAHDLYKRLLIDEMPKLLNERLAFIKGVGSEFNKVYDLIKDADPDFVENLEKQLFTEPDNIKELVEQIQNAEQDGGNH